MQHPIVEVGILHVLQSGLSLESTPLSVNGGILGKDARVHYRCRCRCRYIPLIVQDPSVHNIVDPVKGWDISKWKKRYNR